MAEDMEAKLARMRETWQAGKDKPPGPDNGVYQLLLQSVEQKEAVSSGKQITLWEWAIVGGGDSDGMVFRDIISLEMDGWAFRIAERLIALGVQPPDDPAEFDRIFAYLSETNPMVQARTRRSGSFINVNIMKLLDTAAPAGTARPQTTQSQAKAENADPTSPFQVGINVSFVHDGKTIVGELSAIDRKGGTADVTSGELIYEGVLIADLSVVGEEISQADEASEPSDEGDEVDEEDAAKQALEEFAAAHSLTDAELQGGASLAEIRETLNGYAWNASKLTPDEITLLEANGVAVEKPKPPRKKKSPA